MKTIKQILTISGTLVILSFVLFSCSTSKKTALSCPEFSVNKKNIVATDHKKNKAVISHYKANTRNQSARLSGKNQRKDIIASKNSPAQNDFIVPAIKSVSSLNKIEFSKGLIASIDNATIPFVGNSNDARPLKKLDIAENTKNLIITQPTRCDTIVLKSGSLLIGKVEEIGQTEIKYRKCNNLTGPVISILKSDVSVIIYPNGSHDFITSANVLNSNQINTTAGYSNEPAKNEGLGIAGFVSSLVGLFIAGIPLGLIGVIFGGISLSKIKKQPNKYKGKGLAIASIIIGIIAIVGAIIVLAAV
jgi:hypothetical protein